MSHLLEFTKNDLGLHEFAGKKRTAKKEKMVWVPRILQAAHSISDAFGVVIKRNASSQVIVTDFKDVCIIYVARFPQTLEGLFFDIRYGRKQVFGAPEDGSRVWCFKRGGWLLDLFALNHELNGKGREL